jgi:succinate-semialdehyde dehydrogenase/glutarate-semialdehyde dehydrogenase
MMTGQLEDAALALAPGQLFIDGVWREAKDGARFPVVNPATEQVLAEVASAGSEDALAALDAADAAAKAWARTAPRARSDILRRAFDLIMAKADQFAALITLEMGKPLADALGEVKYGAEFFRWYSEEAVRVGGRNSPSPEGALDMIVTRRPVGTCFFVTPWNFPLAMATRKIGPALAAGCACVIKPASFTPLSTLAVVKVLEEAGVPAGVVNVVPGRRASAISGPIMADKRLRKVSFTGSSEGVQVLYRQAADGVLKVSMALGGCAPVIVFEDADLDVAVASAVGAKLRSNGEACNAANTFYAHESVIDEFSGRLAEAFAALTVGPGIEAGTDLGALVSEGQRDDVASMVDRAVDQGAHVLTGGAVPDRTGYFYPPTVLARVPSDADILRQEIFGPVAPVTSFASVDEVIDRANSVDFGLAGYAYTRDMDLVARLTRELEVGLLAINTGPISNAAAPFGGVKMSGLGREGGPEGIEDYLEHLYVALPRRV